MRDYCLKFISEDQAVIILSVVAKHSVDHIGVIHRPTGEMLLVDNEEVPVLSPVDGWHVNLRIADGTELPEALSEFLVFPISPVRVWA